ncbi:hypothetical protein G7054_g2974 [Neopestalotiopsis clavispora]|nr:hypothetical protein G7054_g2974 [Neopestalotiopsis clavispora]
MKTMRSIKFLLDALLLATTQALPNKRAYGYQNLTDQFISSIGADPSVVPDDAKRVGGCTLTCAILQAAQEDSVVAATSNPTLYEMQADAYWSASAYTEPSCISTPVSLDELSVVVRSAEFAQCKFAVRSGGHSPFAGFAGIDGGLLISMSGFTDLSYDENTQIQRSGMGNRWGNIYSFLKPLGRLIVGGRLNDVGLALATGGGLSHLSNKYGWVGQNVVSYEVMLANGSHVKASATENPDLYFGLKVANNNFGVITHLNQQTYPLGKVWGGVVLYSANYSKDFMAAMADYQTSGQLDTNSAILPYLAVNNDTILSTMVYLDEVKQPEAFAPFYAIPNLTDTTQIYDSFYDFANGGLPDLARWTYGETTMYLDKDAYVELVDVVSDFIPRVQAVNSGTLALMAQPISKSMIAQSSQRGDEPMNVTPREQLWATVNIGWALEADDETVGQILEDMVEAVDAYAKGKGLFDTFRFLNDAAPWQKPLQSFGESSFSRLQSASEEYDPSGVFQRLVPGGFKLLPTKAESFKKFQSRDRISTKIDRG